MLYIFTEEFSLMGRVKRFLKKVLGRNFGGPKMVENSLVMGLKEMCYPFVLNKFPEGSKNIAVVLNGTAVLSKVLNLKNKGFFDKVFAGPNLVVLPSHEKGILKHSSISKLLVPSEWVAEMYIKDAPELKSKLAVWPAGVYVPELKPQDKTIDFLFFNKLKDQSLVNNLKQSLGEYKVKIVNYGKFNQGEYFNLLEKSRYLVYLSESESQGLAMFEAWARNVPTLVWERGFAISDDYKVFGKTSAPYLSESAGISFASPEEFVKLIKELPNKNFEPRQYVLNNFTHVVCARKLLNIIEQNA